MASLALEPDEQPDGERADEWEQFIDGHQDKGYRSCAGTVTLVFTIVEAMPSTITPIEMWPDAAMGPGTSTIVHWLFAQWTMEAHLMFTSTCHRAAGASRRYVMASHDGYGLGHTRRNAAIAMALLADPEAHVVLITGVASCLPWLRHERLTVIGMPPLVKDASGAYVNPDLAFDEAIELRRQLVLDTIIEVQPHAFVIDRHPYGIALELRPAVEYARERGSRVVLGLRDILDEPAMITQELNGAGWADVADLFDDVLVYGGKVLCDHAEEYGLPVTPTYVGWVAERVAVAHRDDDLVVVTGGGGGDAARLYHLIADTARHLEGSPTSHDRRFTVITGPYGCRIGDLPRSVGLVRSVDGCSAQYAEAAAVVQMAGYNSAFEALGAGVRPILLPRRAPRREQAIRASRLAALGVADMIDDETTPSELAWLLNQNRLLESGALARVGIRLDGATTAAAVIAVRSRVSSKRERVYAIARW